MKSKKTSNHGLATWLSCSKGWRSFGASTSAIELLQKHNKAPPYSPFKPTEHIKRFCFRVLRGKQQATTEDWDALVEKLISRGRSSIGTSPSIRRFCKIGRSEKIVAWCVDTMMPLSEMDIKNLCLNFDRKKERSDALNAMMDRAMDETLGSYVPALLKSGKPSKNKFVFIPGPPYSKICYCAQCKRAFPKRGLNFYVHNVGKVCIGCNNRYRGRQRQIEKADQAIKDLAIQVKALNKSIREFKNGFK